jgi:uncharacterized protein YaaQ
MKMIIAILRDEDRENVTLALVNAEFRVTRIASTGGFFHRGSTTLMIGVEEEKLAEAIQIIRSNCTSPLESGAKRATLFVINVSYFEQI